MGDVSLFFYAFSHITSSDINVKQLIKKSNSSGTEQIQVRGDAARGITTHDVIGDTVVNREKFLDI